MTEIEKRAPDKIYQINQTHLLTKSFITKTKTIAIFMNMRIYNFSSLDIRYFDIDVSQS